MNGPPIVVGKQMRKNEFRKSRGLESTARGVMKRAGATPVCVARWPPQTRFVPIVTSGVAPALEEVLFGDANPMMKNHQSSGSESVLKSGERNPCHRHSFLNELNEPSSRLR